jgi:50S ribosomal protein L16 3-hydroxylase
LARKTKKKIVPAAGSASRGSPGLDTLFGISPPLTFANEEWRSEPRVFHHEEFLAPEVFHLPDLQSLESALGIAAPNTIFANLPDRDEEYNQIQLLNPEDVKKAFACKMGISMEPDLAKVTELIFWLRAIQRDLGLSIQTYGRCNIYAIPAGGRTACHYDQNINFVCQITGEKTWELAPNTNLENPITRHTMGTPPDGPTAAHLKGTLPTSLPKAGRMRVVLKPGSVLYVPRGYWHETSSKCDSLSLNFTYDQPSWAHALSAALCAKLLKDPKWRAAAYGLQMDGPLEHMARAEFGALVEESGLGLGEIGFEDLE